MINAKNIINEINQRFPDFKVDSELVNDLAIIGSDLKNYFIERINNGDKIVFGKGVEFINELIDGFDIDDSAGPFLDEIILGLYTPEEKYYEIFMNCLSKKAKRQFEHGIKLWNSQKDSNHKME